MLKLVGLLLWNVWLIFNVTPDLVTSQVATQTVTPAPPTVTPAPTPVVETVIPKNGSNNGLPVVPIFLGVIFLGFGLAAIVPVIRSRFNRR